MSLGFRILISSQGVRKLASYGLWKNVFVQVRVYLVDHEFGSSDFKSGTSFEACYPSFQLTTNQHVALCQYHRDAESCFAANLGSKNWYHVFRMGVICYMAAL